MPREAEIQIQVHKPFDRGQVLADLRVIHGDSLHAARSFAIAALLVGGGGATLVWAFVGMSGLVIFFVVLALFGLYASYRAGESIRRAVDELPAVCKQDSSIILTGDRIVQEYPSIRCEILRAAVLRTRETDAGWLLFYGPHQAVSVPRNGLTDDEVSQLRAFLVTLDNMSGPQAVKSR